MTAQKSCAKCLKTDVPLRDCAKCLSTSYCNRACQRAHWKIHKKACAQLVIAHANGISADIYEEVNNHTKATSASSKVLDSTVSKPFHKLQARRWLHERCKKDVYKLLVDSWRVRKLDEYTQLGITELTDENVTYGMAPFEGFLSEAATKALLPTWWTSATTKECISYGTKASNWGNLGTWVGEGHIEEHYNSNQVVLQMKIFAHQVLGGIGTTEDEKFEEQLEFLAELE